MMQQHGPSEEMDEQEMMQPEGQNEDMMLQEQQIGQDQENEAPNHQMSDQQEEL